MRCALRPFLQILTTVTTVAAATAVSAHPHIFVSTGLAFVAEEGRITGVEVTWQYDEFYSLLVLEDMELDRDYDGVLTAADMAQLDGFDMHWVEGFEGDLYLKSAGGRVQLGPPQPRGTSFDEGRITSRHFRALAVPATGTVTVQAYDPTYYTAYDLGLGLDAPEGCRVAIRPADIGAAQRKLLDELARIPADEDSDYPDVGAEFADTVELTCAAGS